VLAHCITKSEAGRFRYQIELNPSVRVGSGTLPLRRRAGSVLAHCMTKSEAGRFRYQIELNPSVRVGSGTLLLRRRAGCVLARGQAGALRRPAGCDGRNQNSFATVAPPSGV